MFELRMRIMEFARSRRLAALSVFRSMAEAGALMSYGPDVQTREHLAAEYVDRILRGAKPGDLPVQQPTKF
jgi:putative tryptophan/tyrosine transport system substrate-binding protein